MTAAAPPFTFVDDPLTYRPEGTLVVRIPSKAKGKEKLLGTLAQKLQFPHYFGHNWDALDECLGDLSWLKGIERVAIVHEGLPFAADGEHLTVYLSILADAVVRHQQSEVPPLLEVVFATRQQTAVLQ
jgi:hypothetical protein